MEKEELIRLGKGEVLVVPVIRGLVSEGERVRGAVLKFSPVMVAMSISPEELTALKQHDGKDLEPMSGTLEENVYEGGLCKFGGVARPPRCFTAALEVAKEQGIETAGVDLTEAEFTQAYVHLVSGWDFVRKTLGGGRFSRAKFDLSSAEAFVLDWDRRLRKAKGYDALERRREAQVSRGVAELVERKGKVVAIVELERVSGVVERLKRLASPESQ